jgi:hypothetical protein
MEKKFVNAMYPVIYPKTMTNDKEIITNPNRVLSKLRKKKFEVCFKRSMNALHGGINDFAHDMPSMRKQGSKLNKLPMKKMYAWEKELGRHAHADLEHNW